MSKSIDFLWLDDFCRPVSMDGSPKARIHAYDTCRSADEFLRARAQNPPEWAIVDLIVPQDGWREDAGFLRFPGLDFIRHVREQFSDRTRCVVYADTVTEQLREDAEMAGAVRVERKVDISLKDLVREILAVPAQIATEV